MKRTKAKYTYKCVLHFLTLCTVSILFVSLCAAHSGFFQANAAVLSVHNYVTDDTFNYSRDQVLYQVNGEMLVQTPPGLLLSNGAAVGPIKDIFVNKLGVTCDYIDGKNTFSVSYGPNRIKMTLGNTEATVNGEKRYMNNAPVVYSFNGSSEKHLYVPTRFLAEALGFDYIWNDTTSTVSINRPNIIYDGNEPIKYDAGTPVFVLNNTTYTSKNYPGYIIQDTVFFSAEEYFKNTGMASYAYAEGSGLILFKKGNCIVRLVLDSPVAYINDDAYLLDSVPRLITPQNSAKASVYVPAVFVAEALGYQVSYQKSTGFFQVTGAVTEKDTDTSSSKEPSASVLPDTASYGKQLFSYQAHEQVIHHFNSLGFQVPTMVSAYSCINSDALYLKGVAEDNIRITDKADVLEIVISGLQNPFDRKTNYNPEASFLNYFYLYGTEQIRIIIIKEKELHYYTYAAPDGSVIHFTDSNGMYQDYLRFTGTSDSGANQENVSENTDIFAGTDISAYLPEAIFTRDYFVIRLPEKTDSKKITDSDEYNKNRFTIAIPGNHMSFLSEQDTYNPVKTLKNIQFSYKVANNTTVITFNTTKIQGYTYTVADGFLGVKIADPKEIYDKIIVLDAGHGGIDPGTSRGSLYEKTVNFNVVNVYAPEYFNKSDIKVYYTRTDDTKIALQTRADFAAMVGADLFISFHVNAHSNSAVKGTSVYYSKSNNTKNASGLCSSILATTIANRLSNAWGTNNRGIVADKFVVIHNNTVPAVLVECGFITNNSDFEKIRDTTYQKKAAKALYDAVSEIFDKYPTGR